MSRLLGHLTKQKDKKRKDVRAARAVKSYVLDAAGAMDSSECRQRWRRSDIGRQTVPHASRSHWKRVVTEC